MELEEICVCASFTVMCMKLVQEYRPDVSVIVDSVGIWRQAWKRRK